jgi:hypothetical protein
LKTHPKKVLKCRIPPPQSPPPPPPPPRQQWLAGINIKNVGWGPGLAKRWGALRRMAEKAWLSDDIPSVTRRAGLGRACTVIPIYSCSLSLPTPYLLYKDLYQPRPYPTHTIYCLQNITLPSKVRSDSQFWTYESDINF